MLLLLIMLFVMNVFGFLVMWWDKHCARENKWRVPESTLFILALFGGAIGCWLGMRAFRHKTQHWYFVWGMPILMLIDAVSFACIVKWVM